MEIPQLAYRHNVIVPSIIKTLLRIGIKFNQCKNDLQQRNDKSEHESRDSGESSSLEAELEDDESKLADKEDMERQLAKTLLWQFESTWSTPLVAASALDDLYGSTTSHPAWIRKGLAQIGCGTESGIWQSSGWTVMKELQQKLRGMSKLKELIASLGRKPVVKGNEHQKMPPQRKGNFVGVAHSPHSPTGIERPNSLSIICLRFMFIEVSGIRQSNSFEGLLPSEAMLLVNNNLRTDKCSNVTSRQGRNNLLFRVRMAERLLRSYELTGLEEQLSQPKRKPWRNMQMMPITPGGPIIVCLDTSWSMLIEQDIAKAGSCYYFIGH
jgi:uncharacterized protein with von Willebrand factor type A (vWA) domain